MLPLGKSVKKQQQIGFKETLFFQQKIFTDKSPHVVVSAPGLCDPRDCKQEAKVMIDEMLLNETSLWFPKPFLLKG